MDRKNGQTPVKVAPATKVVATAAPTGPRMGGTNPAGSGLKVQDHKAHPRKGY